MLVILVQVRLLLWCSWWCTMLLLLLPRWRM
jgi:hypothetical protein